ncbi:hypothetical protein MXD59_18235 [Frankia sp. Ag45/Mut15]|uniref:Uncharacterized protein n=1 Tax=Frankia umida TaxID=573489 RepID=A0ABT0K1R6_9ACTN|nr:hypothetical protein [Frankia umida]MCK9877690.1 hypothetical protein [Frankia umida]
MRIDLTMRTDTPRSTVVAFGDGDPRTDRSVLRLLVALVVLLSAVTAFAVGGLVALSQQRMASPSGVDSDSIRGDGQRGDDPGDAGDSDDMVAAAGEIGRLGVVDDGVVSRPLAGRVPMAVPPTSPVPTRVPTAVPPTPRIPDDAEQATASPVPAPHRCTQPPEQAISGSGLPIPIFPLC